MAKIMFLDTKNYKLDIEKCLSHLPDTNLIKDKSFFITGGNGLICSSFIHLLVFANDKFNLNLKLYVALRNIESNKYKFQFNNEIPKCIEFIKYDALKKNDFNKPLDFIVHGASPASPNMFITNPVETIQSNIFGLKELLDLAKSKKAKLLYISSSEVYGKLNNIKPISETDLGIIEILNTRSSYGIAKRASENLCKAYVDEYKTNIVIARPGHIYGPTASVTDKRISSTLMFDAFNKKDLILKSKGEQIRSYTYVLDCALALIYILIKGISGEAYNISNPNTIMSIAELAQAFSNYGNVPLKYEIPSENEKKSFNPMQNSSLDSSKLEKLGWTPVFNDYLGIEHSLLTLNELKELANKDSNEFKLKKNELSVAERKSLSLEILDEIHKFCVENNIRYYLHAGTLLGAIRSNSFIPWDDDLDICMPRPDYEKFLHTFKSDKYRISYYKKTLRLCLPFIKVYSINTYGLTPKGRRFPFGLGVDVFPIDGYPKNKNKINRYFRIQDFIFHNFYIVCKSCEYPNMGAKNRTNLIIKYILKYSLFLFIKSPLIACILNIRAKRNKFEKSEFAGCSVGLYRRKLECIKKECFESSVLHKFEGKYYFIPEKYDEVLKSLYGEDYLTPPPPEKQFSIHLEHYYWKKNEKVKHK